MRLRRWVSPKPCNFACQLRDRQQLKNIFLPEADFVPSEAYWDTSFRIGSEHTQEVKQVYCRRKSWACIPMEPDWGGGPEGLEPLTSWLPARRQRLKFNEQNIRTSIFRPFTKQFLYFDHILNQRRYRQHHIFPIPQTENENSVIALTAGGSEKPFMALAAKSQSNHKNGLTL